MDTTIRRRQREAAAGDPAAEAAWLAERLRAAPVCERCGGRRTWRDCSRHRDDQVSCGPACGVWKEALPCPACAGTGSPFRARLELAAYCGSEAARAALGGGWLRDGWVHPDVLAMESWVRGLNAWADVGPVPGWVLVRAAARLVGEAPVRAAISSALIAWALA